MPIKSDDVVCASHILIPYKDPNGKVKEKDLQKFAKTLGSTIGKDKNLFGVAAYKYSVCPSGQNNPNLNVCINKINANSEEEFKEKAKQCILQYGGNLGCFKKSEVDKKFFEAASALKVGQITSEPVKTDFGYHIIRRDPLPSE